MGRVSQLVGAHKAEELLIRGQTLEAEQASGYGLIDRFTPKDRLLDAAMDELEQLLETPGEYSLFLLPRRYPDAQCFLFQIILA